MIPASTAVPASEKCVAAGGKAAARDRPAGLETVTLRTLAAPLGPSRHSLLGAGVGHCVDSGLGEEALASGRRAAARPRSASSGAVLGHQLGVDQQAQPGFEVRILWNPLLAQVTEVIHQASQVEVV